MPSADANLAEPNAEETKPDDPNVEAVVVDDGPETQRVSADVAGSGSRKPVDDVG